MTRKPYLIWIIGHNASGKTTLAKKLASDFNIDRVNGDDFRDFLRDNYLFFKNIEYSKNSHPKYGILNSLTQAYRISVAYELLNKNQDIIYDGSGYNKEVRGKVLKDIKSNLNSDIKVIIIKTEIDEEELLSRLRTRDNENKGTWEQKYLERNKSYYTVPEEAECDVLLAYNQSNYGELKTRIKQLLDNEA